MLVLAGVLGVGDVVGGARDDPCGVPRAGSGRYRRIRPMRGVTGGGFWWLAMVWRASSQACLRTAWMRASISSATWL